MSIRRVLTVLAIVGMFFGPLAGAAIWNARTIIASADTYRKATFEVTGYHCIGGQTTRDRNGNTKTSPMHCFLEGTIEGTAEELPATSGDDAKHPPGSRIDVWYSPELDPFGVNYAPLRVLWDLGDTPTADAEAQVRFWKSFLLAFPILILVLELLYNFTVRPFWRVGDPSVVVVGEEAAVPGLGFGLLGFGLVILYYSVRGGATIAGVIIASLLCVGGFAASMRRVHRLDLPGRTLSSRRGFFPIYLPAYLQDLSDPPEVLVRQATPGGAAELVVGTGVGDERLVRDTDLERVLGIGREIASGLGVALEERWPTDASGEVIDDADQAQAERERRQKRLVGCVVRLAILILLAAGGALFLKLPSLNAPAMTWLLSPDQPRLPLPVRGFAVETLGQPSASDAAVLELLRVANTADPRWEEGLGESALDALERVAGEPFAGADRIARTRVANRWAAERLGRQVDAHGGVLGWYPPSTRFARVLDLVASEDPNEAWVWWDGFGAGDFSSSWQFAANAGSALADQRAISFAIKRGSFLGGPGEGAPHFEGQPVSPADHADEVLVRSVAGALALRMWLYDDVPGDALPADFVGWWNEYARSRLLPPLPESERALSGAAP